MSDGHIIKTGACLVIGDEVLNGKILDTNSKFFAKYCFQLGINVRHMSVVPDDETDIIEEIQKLSAKYDFVVTSGGIGPTHDDITYQSIAKAYGLPLAFHQPTADRMKRISKFRPENEAAQKAQYRMATFPDGPKVKCLFPCDDLWVPVVTLEDKVHILPGVPHLYEKLLNGLTPVISPRVDKSHILKRFFVNLPGAKESNIASYLTDLQHKLDPKGIKIGSYPHMISNSITISIIGDEDFQSTLRETVQDVLANLGGKELSAEEEALQK